MLGFGLMLAIDESFKILKNRQTLHQLERAKKNDEDLIVESINKEQDPAEAATDDTRIARQQRRER